MLFYRKVKDDVLLVQIYVIDIIFGSTNENLCAKFSTLMQSRYEMNMMEELNFFLGLQVKHTEDGIFINQSNYVKDLLKKFDLQEYTTTKTPMATVTKLDYDPKGKHVDHSSYRGTIDSLLYLTTSRPDIMFLTCLCARF